MNWFEDFEIRHFDVNGERGVVQRLFKPIELWQAQCAGQVTGQTMAAGHSLPEELPELTAATLPNFFR